jgi:uncharacterized protein YjiS (DUF1127 family)
MVCRQLAGRTIGKRKASISRVLELVDMPTLMVHTARDGSQFHQKNWGAGLAHEWRRWRLRSARHGQRRALRDLADDPHLLADIGVTREQALEEADKPFWR